MTPDSPQITLNCGLSGKYAVVVVTDAGEAGIQLSYWGYRENVDCEQLAALQAQYPNLSLAGWKPRGTVIVEVCQAYIATLRETFMTTHVNGDTYDAVADFPRLIEAIKEDPQFFCFNWLHNYLMDVAMADELFGDDFLLTAWINMLDLSENKLMPFWAIDRLHSERAALSTDNYAPARSR